MTDYSFMKTGFDMVGNDERENQKNIVALVTLFGTNAIRTSFIYVKHAKRGGVTVEDIKRAVMLETFFFMKRPDVMEKANEIKNELFNSFEEDAEDSEDEEDVEGAEGEENEEIVEVFAESECSCALCSCINKIYERWAAWTPQTPMEKILKKSVENFGSVPLQST